jgi:hypothetical protein
MKDEKRPEPHDRRDLIKIIVDQMCRHCDNPNKRHCEMIAFKLVQLGPKSFQDRDIITNEVIGTGYESVWCQLKSRVENKNRSGVKGHEKSLWRRRTSTANDEGKGSREPGKRKLVDGLGCVNWAPEVPDGVEDKAQSDAKADLQKMFEMGPEMWVNDSIDKLMALSYAKQRVFLNDKPIITSITREWPFLFCPRWALQHFKELVGVDLMAVLGQEMTTKGARIVKYFESVGKAARKEVKQVLRELGDDTSGSVRVDVRNAAMLLLLMAHFEEREDTLFLKAEASYFYM